MKTAIAILILLGLVMTGFYIWVRQNQRVNTDERVSRGLTAADLGTRMGAVQLIRRTGNSNFVPVLLSAWAKWAKTSKSEDTHARQKRARPGFTFWGPSQEHPAFEESELVSETKTTLTELSRTDLQPIINALRDPTVDKYALEIMVELGSSTVTSLIEALERHPHEGGLIPRALAEIHDERAIPALIKVLLHDHQADAQIFDALARFGSDPLNQLIAIYTAPTSPPWLKQSAARALARGD